MACVNMDNKPSADTNTGEEAHASDIVQPVVGSGIGRETDQVV